jgi:hypothetical protein
MCNFGCGSDSDYWASCILVIEDGIIKSVINILPELYFKDNIIKLVYEFVRSGTLLGGTYYDYELLVSVLADKAIFRD